ncbi:hypothetical protein KGF56_004053 [Candida oxycetoniae]|uniref:ferric-chelate reductase (NADPH) n=1 Tax=Candida oxycetoniae TaxID=497107 RepID=A0AAI9SVB3_9ASCO|nr:uncharacterized protein KGF56_004053 [Candida oxycetoniae]KAI3403164.2 hypothetical protein KGF56_004053 [Candida oxycetoniae]
MVASKLVVFVVSALLLGLTEAENNFKIYHADEFPVQACTGLLGKTAKFDESKKPTYCSAKNQPALGTMAECIERLAKTRNKNSRRLFLKSCKKQNLTEEKYLDAFANATEFGFVNVTQDKSFNKTKPYYKPIYLSPKKIDAAYDAVATRWYNYNYAHWFGISLMCYWIGVVLFAGVVNLLSFICPNFIKSLKGRAVNTFRSWITLPALFNKTHAHHKTFFKHVHVMFPTRLESFIMFGWFVMALVMSCTNYHHVKPNYIWPQEWNEMGRKIGDRTGIMVLWCMPVLVLFAGRNNFLQWISGWPQARFLYFHKWVSANVFLLSIVHSVGMTFNGRGIGKYGSRMAKPYVRWGVVSMVIFGIMCVQALAAFRRNNYELFLLAHIILAAFSIAGLWIHTSDQGLAMWMYGAVSVWVFDRAVRIARLFVFGLRKAQVELIANETLKVTVKRPAHWIPFPGCHAFIYFMRPTCFWQSHPFTVVDSVEQDCTITFYLKVKGGMTHGLYQYLSKQPGQKAHINVSVEGPYGNPMPINRYESGLFIAGGNGIPGIYYEATSIAKKMGSKRNIKLIWVIRHYRSLEWFYPELQKLESLPIETTIYVTQPHVGLVEPIVTNNTDDEVGQEEEQEKKSDSEESSEYIAKSKKDLTHIEFIETRPDLYAIVGEEISATATPLAIASCAHGNMVDDIRKSVCDHLNNSTHRIELFEQVQTW